MNNLYYILLCKIVYIYMGWEKSNTSIFSLSGLFEWLLDKLKILVFDFSHPIYIYTILHNNI